MKINTNSLSLLLLMSSLPFSCSTALAQLESGTVNGDVTDPSGAAVPGAQVTITDVGTNISQTAVTSAHGAFHFATLKPSHYRIKISAPGFKESVIEDVELHTQDSLNENVALTLGSASDTVSVNAESEASRR